MRTLGIVVFVLAIGVLAHGCAGMGCLNPFTTLSDCGGKHGIWP